MKKSGGGVKRRKGWASEGATRGRAGEAEGKQAGAFIHPSITFQSFMKAFIHSFCRGRRANKLKLVDHEWTQRAPEEMADFARYPFPPPPFVTTKTWGWGDYKKPGGGRGGSTLPCSALLCSALFCLWPPSLCLALHI